MFIALSFPVFYEHLTRLPTRFLLSSRLSLDKWWESATLQMMATKKDMPGHAITLALPMDKTALPRRQILVIQL
jgi:hypothetical protein